MTPFVSNNNTSLALLSLGDATKCTVEKTESGKFVLQLEYPYNGEHADMLITGNYIFAKSSRADSNLERFKVSKVSQNINGIVSVEANQLVYDLALYPVRAFEKATRTPKEAVAAICANAVRSPSTDSLNLIAADVDLAREFGVDRPVSIREAVYGSGGLIDVYGGCVESSGYNMIWHRSDTIGANKGVIRYGVNLLKYKKAIDISDTYSHAYVYWQGMVDTLDEDGNVTGSEEKLIEYPGLASLSGTTEFAGATIMDLSDEFETAPTEQDLSSRALKLAKQRGIIDPEISLDISFVPLRLTDEYKDLTFLEEVDLFDTVSVEVPMYGTTKARVTGAKFNVLTESYDQITLGNTRNIVGRLIAHLFK